jgi:hypothetical protein
MNVKIDMNKALKIGGMVLTIAGTIVSAVANDKEKAKLIDESVLKHLAEEK